MKRKNSTKRKLVINWDETPEFICRGCGYHKKNCVCSVQKPIVVNTQPEIKASVDFYS